MILAFLGGFVSALLPSFIVWFAWSMFSAVSELDVD